MFQVTFIIYYFFTIRRPLSDCADSASIGSSSGKRKLHKNLIDILNDKTLLSFFIQYLESKNGLPFVKFWLDVETFKAVGETTSSICDRTESRMSNYDRLKEKRRRSDTGCDTFRDYDSISNATSISNFDETEEIPHTSEVDEIDHSVDINDRMTQSLTDDEKSKICEKSRDQNDLRKEDVDGKSSDDSRKFRPLVLEDALRIYRKYLVTDSNYPVELPATILAKLSLALCGNDSDSDIDLNNLWQAFEDAQKFVFDVMEKEFLCEFVESPFYGKYTVDVLTDLDNLCLEEIMCSESALFYFMEFLEQDKENCKLQYLEFWLSAVNFRKQLAESDELNGNQLRSDALVIYEKWFSLQATSPLNFSNKVRVKVEELICLSSPTCFDTPIRIVELFLERNCFKKFIKSQLFFKHLSEVMSKAETIDKGLHNGNGIIRRNSSLSLKFPKGKHRRTNSESLDNTKKGMTRSISAQNTLLAGLDYKKHSNNSNKTDLQIDSRQLIDPDLLWRRQSSTLSFGRVDEYGRYKRDFEMPLSGGSASIQTSKSFQLQNEAIDIDDPQSILDQAKWSGTQSMLKNAMRKLVHLPEDTVQQEIAWQVAELIVKDVTKITLNNEKC